jgi:thioester reductase-like protein
LLRELLRQTTADVYCLIRAQSIEDARKRIADNLRQYELQVPEAVDRVIPVCGDLAEPRLGLSQDEFDALAATVDVVYHNGAYVNFVYPYRVLKPANVKGTIEVLRLATKTKVKPLHFVSTVSVFDSSDYAAVGTIHEEQPLTALGTLQGGYAQSKCVAEKLVRTAGERGLPVAVYRPGRVTADSETGAESAADYTTLLLRLCIDMKTAPASDDRVDMTPVDYVAQAVVGLAQRPEAVGKTFHLINPQPVPVRDVYRAIRATGFPLEEVPTDAWRTSAIRWGTHSQDASFTAFSHWLMLMAPASGSMPTAATTAPQPVTIASGQTQRAVQAIGVSCPVLDIERLRKQVLFLVRNKLCPPPPRPTTSAMHRAEVWRSLVPLRSAGMARPLFCIHGLGGYVVALLPLAQALARGRKIYGLQALGLEAGQEPQDRIKAMAASYLAEIQGVQPEGPYLLSGWSMGGLIAIEAARQLQAAGQEVALVAMIDTYLSIEGFQDDVDDRVALERIASQLEVPLAELKRPSLEQQWARIAELADQANGESIDVIRRLAAACQAHLRALAHFQHQPYAGRCVLFPAVGGRSAKDRRWKTICPQLCVEPVPGDHYDMLREPHVRQLAEHLDRCMQECDVSEKEETAP